MAMSASSRLALSFRRRAFAFAEIVTVAPGVLARLVQQAVRSILVEELGGRFLGIVLVELAALVTYALVGAVAVRAIVVSMTAAVISALLLWSASPRAKSCGFAVNKHELVVTITGPWFLIVFPDPVSRNCAAIQPIFARYSQMLFPHH